MVCLNPPERLEILGKKVAAWLEKVVIVGGDSPHVRENEVWFVGYE